MTRPMRALFVVAVFSLVSAAQNSQPGAQKEDALPDAQTLLKEVRQRYEHSQSYHVEATETREMDGDFSHDWSKSVTAAIVSPGNRYRFESRTRGAWWIQISDGKTEWLYQPASHQYTQQLAPANGPSRFKSQWSHQFYELNRAQDTVKDLSRFPPPLASAAYLPDETLTLNNHRVDCYVIQAAPRHWRGWAHDTTSVLTLWIDKDKHVIRKSREHMEGAIVFGEPHEHYVSDELTTYDVADLDPTSIPPNVFAFTPPPTATLIKEFEDPMRAHATTTEAAAEIVGKPAPAINLKSADGKTISLSSFAGKPVLIDFWATWCGSCLDAIPSLEKLYSKTAGQGLVVLGIDEDEEPQDAADYLAEHKEPWANFHDSGEITKSLPHEGIPYFVLVDGTGRVVYVSSGFDESELIANVAKLGPAFAALASEGEVTGHE
jgi:thiol-disulfide isomerase/thioredoxin/outer membrane lipoprotein-sorting protein